MLMVTLLSEDAAYAAPPSPIITDVFSPGLELISMDVFCSGSSTADGGPVVAASPPDGDTCTTVLFASSPWCTTDGSGGGGGGSDGLSNTVRLSGLLLCRT